MAFTLDNFVRSVLALDAVAADTSLTLALSVPPYRNPPNASSDAPGVLILQDQAGTPTQIEIVTYVGATVNGTQVVLSGVVRGCEGTQAQSWSAGAQAFGGLTAAVMGSFLALSGGNLVLPGGITCTTVTASGALTCGTLDVTNGA